MLLSKWLPPLLDWLLSCLLVTVLVIVILVYVYQERLIYMPAFPPGSRTDVWTPDRFGMRYEHITLESADGTKTQNYYIPWQSAATGKPKVAIIFCPANAGNLGHRLPIVRKIRETCAAAVFMPSYRGYGKSEGSPCERGIRMDVQAGLDWFCERLDSESEEYQLVAFGQSIGGAVAIDLVCANRDRFSGLIVENTFTSLPDLIPHVIPALRFMAFLCRDKWESEERLKSLAHGPLRMLILSGGKDLLIPPSHSARLLECATGRLKEVKLVTFKEGGHNDTVLQGGYFEAVTAFLDGL